MAGMAACVAAPALAHRGHHTLSVVEITRLGKVTVTHYLSAHDTEPELTYLAPDAQASVDDPEAFAALEAHLGAAFLVNDLTLSPSTNTMAGDDLVFEFKGQFPEAPKTVTITYGLFPRSKKTGVGLVNIRLMGITKSLTFHRGDGPKSVSFA